MSLRLLSFFLVGCFLSVTSASAGIMNYKLTGGSLEGTLNGVQFVGKSVTITASADTNNFAYSSALAGGVLYAHQAAASTMTIDGFSPFQITTPNFGIIRTDWSGIGSENWFGFAALNGQTNAPGFYALAFNSLSLLESGSVTGDFVSTGGVFSTTAGNLNITNATQSTGLFVSTVPEPGSIAIVALGALGMAYQVRRNRKAK